jgi:disulfide bond formation protein DsbB
MLDLISFLSALTLISNIVLGLFITLFLLNLLGIFKSYWKLLLKKISPKAVLLAFIVSLTATLGSLYLSEIRGFEPCKLCWLQRIFMYPLPVILGVALWRKTKDVWQYVLPLSIIGLVIAIYHYYYQINPVSIIPCSTVGFSVSCSERFFTHFGYITIPWMSATAFALTSMGMLISKK